MSQEVERQNSEGAVAAGGFLKRPLVVIAVASVLGIVGAEVMPSAFNRLYWWGPVFLLGVVGLFLSRGPRLMAGMVLVCSFLGGGAWYALRALPYPDDLSHFASREPAEIQGFVLERKAKADGGVDLKVRVESLRTLRESRKVSGTTLVYPRGETEARPGDEVRCVGEVQKPLAATNWGQFSYEAYLTKHDTYSVFFAESVEVVRAVQGRPLPNSIFLGAFDGSWQRGLVGWAGRAQVAIRGTIAQAMPPRNRNLLTTLLCAILFGDRSYPMPASVEEDFRLSGTIHVMVVSGTQVSLIAAFVLLLMKRSPVPLWLGSLLTVGFLGLYVLVVGPAPSVMRAGMMVVVAALARVFSRELDIYGSLAFSLLAILFLNPASLFDVGLQLSYLATFGIIVLALPIIRALPYIPKVFSGTMGATLGSQVLVAPALAYYFHRFPLAGLGANLVVVPSVALLTGLGVLTLLLGFCWPLGAMGVGAITAPVLEFMMRTVSGFAHCSWARMGQVGLSLPEVLVVYGLLFALLSLLLPSVRGLITKERVLVGVATLGVGGGIWLLARVSSPGVMKVTALDVERGFSGVVESPSGEVFLLDGGGPAKERWNAGETVVLPFLLREGVRRINSVVVTDSDYDHTAGLAPVLAEMPVGRVMLLRGESPPERSRTSPPYISAGSVSGGSRAGPSSSLEKVLQVAHEKGIEVVRAGSHQRMEIGKDVRLTAGGEGEGPEGLLLSLGRIDFLWATTADKVPLTGLSPGQGRRMVLFLPVKAKMTPELKEALVSGALEVVVLSARSYYDTLEPSFKDVLYSDSCRAKVFRTDVDGAVQVTTDGESLKVKAFRRGP